MISRNQWETIIAYNNFNKWGVTSVHDTWSYSESDYKRYIWDNLDNINNAIDVSFEDGPSCDRRKNPNLYMTFLSANNAYRLSQIINTAKQVNQDVEKYLKNWVSLTGDRGTWGAILMDFPYGRLIDIIIHQNWMRSIFWASKSNWQIKILIVK